MNIDVVIIISVDSNFMSMVIEKSEGKPILLIAPEKTITELSIKEFNSNLQIIFTNQSLEILNDKLILLSNSIIKTGSKIGIYSQISKREKEILLLIAKGKKNKEIAAELFISVKTIENHRNNIIKKTKTKSMLILINELHKFGFLKE